MTHDEKRYAYALAACKASGDDPSREGPFRRWYADSPYAAIADAILALTPPPATSEIGAEGKALLDQGAAAGYAVGLEDAANYLVGKACEMRGENPSPTAGMMARIFEEQATAIRSLSAAPTPQAAEPDTSGYAEWADERENGDSGTTTADDAGKGGGA